MCVLGLPELDATHPPTMVSSKGETVGTAVAGGSFVDLLFETNPLDGACDTRIRLSARPLETTFDAVCMKLFLGQLRRVHLIISIWGSNVRTSVRPKKFFPILMKFGM